MKTYLRLSLILVPVILFSCGGNRKLVRELSRKNPVHLTGDYQPEKNRAGGYDYSFYLNKGDRIPVSVTLDTAYLDIKEKELSLVLKKKLYFFIRTPVRISDMGKENMSDQDKKKLFQKLIIYLSPDGKTWASYRDAGRVKDAFGIKGGSISLGMGVSKETGIKGMLGIMVK